MIFSHYKSQQSQRGATLIIGLIMLVTLTLIVSTAFTLSSSNLKSVRNMQLRNEAISAANVAIETVVASTLNPANFNTAPPEQTINVDINNDGTEEYQVKIAAPTCTRATLAVNSTLSSLSLPVTMSSSNFWNTIWDVDATATEITNATGTTVHVRSGTRVKLSDTQKNKACP